MRSVAGVALIAPARGRASKKIINIMHTGAARCFWKPKWPWVKTKPPKPAKPSTTGRAVCNARFLLREVHVSGAYPVRAPERGPRSQTHAQRRNLGISVRPGHPAPAATCPAHVRYFHAIWFPSRLRPSKLAPTLRPCRPGPRFRWRYPVSAPERGHRSQTHAQRRNLGISVRPDHRYRRQPAGLFPAGRPGGGSRYITLGKKVSHPCTYSNHVPARALRLLPSPAVGLV